MAALIELPTFADARGKLTVIERILPFNIKRTYFIYDTDKKERGGHRHKITTQAIVCLKGSCIVSCDNSFIKEDYLLDKPHKCLIIYPEDYHVMKNFTKDAILLVFASEEFIEEDYIDEPYDTI